MSSDVTRLAWPGFVSLVTYLVSGASNLKASSSIVPRKGKGEPRPGVIGSLQGWCRGGLTLQDRSFLFGPPRPWEVLGDHVFGPCWWRRTRDGRATACL